MFSIRSGCVFRDVFNFEVIIAKLKGVGLKLYEFREYYSVCCNYKQSIRCNVNKSDLRANLRKKFLH